MPRDKWDWAPELTEAELNRGIIHAAGRFKAGSLEKNAIYAAWCRMKRAERALREMAKPNGSPR